MRTNIVEKESGHILRTQVQIFIDDDPTKESDNLRCKGMNLSDTIKILTDLFIHYLSHLDALLPHFFDHHLRFLGDTNRNLYSLVILWRPPGSSSLSSAWHISPP